MNFNERFGLYGKAAASGGLGVTAARGFRAAGVHSGVKKQRPDLALIYSERPASFAGVFTQSTTAAAPVRVSRQHLQKGLCQVVVINSGNANACTGGPGLDNAWTMVHQVAGELGIDDSLVAVGSTGVIGVPLPMDKVGAGITRAAALLRQEVKDPAAEGEAAASAIVTTDGFTKWTSQSVDLGGTETFVGGMAKGAGMIHPNMATMLAVLTTDAAVAAPVLQLALEQAVNVTFNRISVDGDTSTNDSVFLLANGMAGSGALQPGSAEFLAFVTTLTAVCEALARAIVADGEGATKVAEVRVTGAVDDSNAELAARAVANSSLVKTALYGHDANWGRILAALGYSGAHFDPATVDVYIGAGELQVCSGGMGLDFDEERALQLLKPADVVLDIRLGRGPGQARIWTSDLTEAYVRLNGSYRT